MSTTKGIGKVPSPYLHLSFSRYNILTPGDPALEGYIVPSDLNCAVSVPNALIGSRYISDAVEKIARSRKLKGVQNSEEPEGAYFEITNDSALIAEGLHPYFTLHKLYIKPLAAPFSSSGTNVTIRGYSRARKDPLSWDVNFASDYHEPFEVKIQKYSKQEWSQLYGVEILADYGEDKLDWEFCLDDLEVEFFKIREEVVGSQPEDQVILESLERGL